jgi:hypothetical protein
MCARIPRRQKLIHSVLADFDRLASPTHAAPQSTERTYQRAMVAVLRERTFTIHLGLPALGALSSVEAAA